MKEFLGQSLKQQSLFFKGKIVLFDEVDGISGRHDRGAAKEMSEAIKQSKHPVFMTTCDDSSSAVKALKKISKVVKFEKIDTETILKILAKACAEKGVLADDKALKGIARRSDGDLRAALNDLHSMAYDGELKSARIDGLGFRDSEKEIQEALTVILKTMDSKIADEVMRNLEVSPDNAIEWIRENVPYEYKNVQDLARGFNAISRADVFAGRIHRQQYFRYLVYVSQMLSIGVATAKDSKYMTPPLIARYPSKIRILGQTKFSRAKEKSVATALSGPLHVSTRVAKQYFPLLRLVRDNDPELWESICDETGIEDVP